MWQEATDLEASKNNSANQNYSISKIEYTRKCKQLKRNISLIRTERCQCLEDLNADALPVKVIFPASTWTLIISKPSSFNTNVRLSIFFLIIKNTSKVFLFQESQENTVEEGLSYTQKKYSYKKVLSFYKLLHVTKDKILTTFPNWENYSGQLISDLLQQMVIGNASLYYYLDKIHQDIWNATKKLSYKNS